MSRASDSSGGSTVLVIEDDRELADTYSIWLEPEYDVKTAYSGAHGLTLYDSTIDIVLLDRRIPEFSGSSLVRNMERREVDDQRAFLTSIDPGQEIVDLPCDDYLTKPVTKSKLRDTIRELQIRSRLDDEFQEHFTLISKIAALENSNATDIESAIDDLRREAERTRASIQEKLSEIEDFEAAFKTIESSTYD